MKCQKQLHYLLTTAIAMGCLPLASLAATQPKDDSHKRAGTYWLIFNATDTVKQFRVCDKKSLATPNTCPVWKPDSDFFEAGSFIRLKVLNGHLRSTYNVVVNGTAITDNVPAVRGVANASSAQTPSSGAPTPSPNLPAFTSTEQNDFAQLQALYTSTKPSVDNAATLLVAYEGTPLATNAQGSCSAASTTEPGASIQAVLKFSVDLSQDSTACSTSKPDASDIAGIFDSLTTRTDNLVAMIPSLNNWLTSITPAISGATNNWATYDAQAQAFATKYPNASATEARYLPNGDLYQQTATNAAKLKDIGPTGPITQWIATINGSLGAIFFQINAYYATYRDPNGTEVPVGQYSTSYAGNIQVTETAGFTRYAIASTTQSGQQQPVAPGPLPIPNPNGIGSPTAQTNPGGAAPANAGNQGNATPSGTPAAKPLFNSSFEVHRFYRANLVGGFFASTLRSREYGVATNSSSVLVATVGNSHMPQLHYFAGIDYYVFGQRDLFPGAMKASDYWKPALMFGYGLDTTNNFVLGPNWETKWGLTLGGGWAIGQETFLAPGIMANSTPLPSGTATAPTVNRTRGGGFISVGFDLSVFKSAFSQLTGGGGSSTTPSGSSQTPSTGGKSK
jgi:hypothetical protein